MVNLLDFSLYLCFSVFKVLFSVFVSVESFFMVYSVGALDSGFDPDVVLVVYFFAHAWVKFTAHGQLDMHKLYCCMRAHLRLLCA